MKLWAVGTGRDGLVTLMSNRMLIPRYSGTRPCSHQKVLQDEHKAANSSKPKLNHIKSI
ncbi:hypothetical protein V1291_000252 [Nitrobacteraceae bacterium AZCC 1564]